MCLFYGSKSLVLIVTKMQKTKTKLILNVFVRGLAALLQNRLSRVICLNLFFFLVL